MITLTPQAAAQIHASARQSGIESPCLRVAAREGIELTPDHWEVVRFMRTFYEERRIAPDARHVLKHLAQ